jgi:hypothetical protein
MVIITTPLQAIAGDYKGTVIITALQKRKNLYMPKLNNREKQYMMMLVRYGAVSDSDLPDGEYWEFIIQRLLNFGLITRCVQRATQDSVSCLSEKGYNFFESLLFTNEN